MPRYLQYHKDWYRMQRLPCLLDRLHQGMGHWLRPLYTGHD